MPACRSVRLRKNTCDGEFRRMYESLKYGYSKCGSADKSDGMSGMVFRKSFWLFSYEIPAFAGMTLGNDTINMSKNHSCTVREKKVR